MEQASDHVVTCLVFKKYVAYMYKNWMPLVRKNAKAMVGVDIVDRTYVWFPPTYIPTKIWSQMIDSWMDPKWVKNALKAFENQKRKTNYMSYHGSSHSIECYRKDLRKQLGYKTCETEVFKQCHTRALTNDWTNDREKTMYKSYEGKRVASNISKGISNPFEEGSSSTPAQNPMLARM